MINCNSLNLIGPGVELIELINNGVISVPFQNLKILDVGYGDPGSFILFHHLHGFQQYLGIDQIDELNFRIYLPVEFGMERSEECVSVGSDTPYVRYRTFYNCFIKRVGYSVSELLSEQDFEQIFNFKFGTSVQQYLADELKEDYRPNLLVLSKFLHCLNDQNEVGSVYNDLLNFSSDDCLVLIKVYTEQPCEPSKLVFSEKDVTMLESRLKVLHKERMGKFTLIVGNKEISHSLNPLSLTSVRLRH